MDRRRTGGRLLLATGGAVLLTATALPARAAAPAAVWQMDEGPGASVMHDSSGNGLDGSIGAEVSTGRWAAGQKGYVFAYHKNGTGSAHPSHLVTVPDDHRLDPGSGDFSLTVQVKYSGGANFTNVLQKGQSGTKGGFYKVEINRGKVVCLFRGSGGQAAIGSPALWDGKVHTVTCDRTAGGVTMTVDGRQTARASKRTGTIDNAAPLVIGGKPWCNQTTVECDYYAGFVGRVQVG